MSSLHSMPHLCGGDGTVTTSAEGPALPLLPGVADLPEHTGPLLDLSQFVMPLPTVEGLLSRQARDSNPPL